MRKILFLSLMLMACNSTELVSASTPIPKPTTPAVSPTPTPPIVIVQVTDHDCGNATYQTMDTYDADDPGGPPDSYWCYWVCAIDTGSPAFPGDPNPPHEVLKHYDYDPPSPAQQFDNTVYLPCYSVVP